VGVLFELHSFQQIQANKCDEATKAGGFGGAVTEFRSWVMHTEDGIIKKTGDVQILVNLDDSRFDCLTLQKMSAM